MTGYQVQPEHDESYKQFDGVVKFVEYIFS